MQDYLIEMLCCPFCHGELHWRIDERRGDRIEAGVARCAACDAAYPVQDGIGVFLTPDLARRDLWAAVESELSRHLRENPDVERRLMDPPLADLAPADQMFRSMTLRERGDYAGAKAAADASYPGMYTAHYLACWRSQLDQVAERVAGGEGPLVDLASGLCILVEELAARTTRLIVATDFSPGVLRGDRAHLEMLGLYERVSLLAFDARRTPFVAGAVETMTTNVGLANIEQPGALLAELRRVVGGRFLAVSHFFPPDDITHRDILREFGMEAMLYRESALAAFHAAGWQVTVVNSCRCRALPTPASELLDGARIDGLPVAETEFEWCVVVAE